MEAEFLSQSPFRFQEKGNLEVLLFSIQSKLRACNRRLFVPREGCGIWDIDKVRVSLIQVELGMFSLVSGNLEGYTACTCTKMTERALAVHSSLAEYEGFCMHRSVRA